LDGTLPPAPSYMEAGQGRRFGRRKGRRKTRPLRVVKIMKDMKNTLRVVGILLLGLFVLVIGVPLVLAAAGIIVSSIISIAVLLIKVGVTLAVGYLILVGVRALLR
jgi:hypothetical protein